MENRSLGADEAGKLSSNRDWTLMGFVYITVEMGKFLSILSGWETHSKMHFGNITVVLVLGRGGEGGKKKN